MGDLSPLSPFSRCVFITDGLPLPESSKNP